MDFEEKIGYPGEYPYGPVLGSVSGARPPTAGRGRASFGTPELSSPNSLPSTSRRGRSGSRPQRTARLRSLRPCVLASSPRVRLSCPPPVCCHHLRTRLPITTTRLSVTGGRGGVGRAFAWPRAPVTRLRHSACAARTLWRVCRSDLRDRTAQTIVSKKLPVVV